MKTALQKITKSCQLFIYKQIHSLAKLYNSPLAFFVYSIAAVSPPSCKTYQKPD